MVFRWIEIKVGIWNLAIHDDNKCQSNEADQFLAQINFLILGMIMPEDSLDWNMLSL